MVASDLIPLRVAAAPRAVAFVAEAVSMGEASSAFVGQ
jgi:hypothetical protein